MSTTAPRNVGKTVTIMSATSNHSADYGSAEGSVLGQESFATTGNAVLPEQWTLPKEWNIEMREMYGSWKMDVQTQISSLGKQLFQSLQEHPYQLSSDDTNCEDLFEEDKRRRAAQQLLGRMRASPKWN